MKLFTILIKNYYFLSICFLLLQVSLFAGQTGKIAGYITDKTTGEAIIGANVLIENTYFGAAADIDGYYYINNIPPGEYVLKVSSVGYSTTKIQNVVVKIDLTTDISVELSSESFELGEEVVVQATRPLVTNDLTSSSVTVSSKDINMMPVENIDDIVGLQAGVMDGHFRGGRRGEVGYLIDGVPVNDAFNGSRGVNVENNAIREVEIISGTFNAEYGQAMSGIVNIVTKEGSANYEGSVSFYSGTFFTDDPDLFYNLDEFGSNYSTDFQFNFSGPTPLGKDLSFFVSGRYFKSDGYLYGQRIFNNSDDTPLAIAGPNNEIILRHNNTGDGEFVSMNPSDNKSLHGKLSYFMPSMKFTYSVFWDDSWWKGYNHGFRQTPDATKDMYKRNLTNKLDISFYPSQSTFTSLKLAYSDLRTWAHLYEDEYDPRYVLEFQGSPLSGYTYNSGGNELDRWDRTSNTFIAQWSLSSQISKEHKIKVGAEGRMHNIDNAWKTLKNFTDANGNPYLDYSDVGTDFNTKWVRKPYEFAAYIQDKMEYDIMIINAGVRFDYFNANTTIPADIRNPSRLSPNPNFPGAGESVDVEAKFQISPRFGVSFPISDKGVIHFSYGHFFQIPNFEDLYRNVEYNVNQLSGLNTQFGNPDLKPQKTVKYELGLQQVLFPNVALDFSVYYSDIRDLLSQEIKQTYEGFRFAQFINQDYGNVKGFIVSIDKRFADYFSAKLDYTFQIAEGNSSDKEAVFQDNQSDPPVETEKKLIPLNWDQRSTLNLSATVGIPGDWTVGLIFQYGSGTPYTEDAQVSKGVRFENGGTKPAFYNLDLKADKRIEVFGLDMNLFLLAYNVLDIRNELNVFPTTGRANADLNTRTAGPVLGLNTIDEYLADPTRYSAPREVRVGFSLSF
jgi:outer membrane receptor protein involved in Fe transport